MYSAAAVVAPGGAPIGATGAATGISAGGPPGMPGCGMEPAGGAPIISGVTCVAADEHQAMARLLGRVDATSRSGNAARHCSCHRGWLQQLCIIAACLHNVHLQAGFTMAWLFRHAVTAGAVYTLNHATVPHLVGQHIKARRAALADGDALGRGAVPVRGLAALVVVPVPIAVAGARAVAVPPVLAAAAAPVVAVLQDATVMLLQCCRQGQPGWLQCGALAEHT